MGVSLDELRWPTDVPEFEAAAEKLRSGSLRTMLDAVWKGYDRFFTDVVAMIDLCLADAAREDSITKHLQIEISRCIGAFSAVDCVSFWRESHSRVSAGAQQPEYDMAFVLRENRRSAWPLEAKVLASPHSVSEYLRDLREQFVTCRYAPFSSGGAMVGYLLAGSAETCLKSLNNAVEGGLVDQDMFPDRPHRLSFHDRSEHAKLGEVVAFRCHHLIMQMHSPIA